jgi:hypothetical protein
MSEHEVKLAKGRDGWEAKTSIELPDNRVLVIETGKYSERGRAAGVKAIAQVYTRDNGFLSMRMEPFSSNPLDGDFRKVVLVREGKCTELSVRTLHSQALVLVDTLLVEVAAHYQAKAARDAAKAAEA